MKYILSFLLTFVLILFFVFTYINRDVLVQKLFKNQSLDNSMQLEKSLCKLDLGTIKELHYIAPGYNKTETAFYIGIRDYTDPTTSEQTSQLFKIDKDMQCDSLKPLYSITIPGVDGFYIPSITPTFKYIWALKREEGDDDYILLDMNGNILTNGVVKANPEIADSWDASSVVRLTEEQGGKDDFFHLVLTDFYGTFYGKKDAIVQIDMRDGKTVKGTFKEL